MARKEVKSEITGSVWKIEKQKHDHVVEEETLMILESMKMEIPLMAPCKGRLLEVLVTEGEAISEGQVVAVIEI